MTDRAQLHHDGYALLRQALRDTWQRDSFDHLVNNAGHGDMASIAETTEAQFDALVNVHFKGVFFLTQVPLPLMADGARIVNISSGLTRIAYPGFAAYSAVKGALEVLSVYLAKEGQPGYRSQYRGTRRDRDGFSRRRRARHAGPEQGVRGHDSAWPSPPCALTRATEATPSATRKPRQSLNGQSRKRRTMRCQNLEPSGAYLGNSRGSNNCDAR